MSLHNDKLNDNPADNDEITDALDQLEKAMMEAKRKELVEKNKGRLFDDVTERYDVQMSAKTYAELFGDDESIKDKIKINIK